MNPALLAAAAEAFSIAFFKPKTARICRRSTPKARASRHFLGRYLKKLGCVDSEPLVDQELWQLLQQARPSWRPGPQIAFK